mgnify:CR=1 FL=1|jgi:hypothetical protein
MKTAIGTSTNQSADQHGPNLTIVQSQRESGDRRLPLHLQSAVDDPRNSMTESQAWSYVTPEKTEPEVDLDSVQVCAHLRGASRADALRWMGYKVPEGYTGPEND